VASEMADIKRKDNLQYVSFLLIKASCKNCELLRNPLFMTLSVKNVQQNFKSGHNSVENFEIPGLLPSRTTDEIIED